MHDCNAECHRLERMVMEAEEEVRLLKTVVAVLLILDGQPDYIAMLLNRLASIYDQAA